MLSTPAVSALIRKINQEAQDTCVGGILLTASHNPGGENEDFGIKFNTKNGGPALENLTNAIFENTKKITRILTSEVSDIDISKIAEHDMGKVDRFEHNFQVSVVDSCDYYV